MTHNEQRKKNLKLKSTFPQRHFLRTKLLPQTHHSQGNKAQGEGSRWQKPLTKQTPTITSFPPGQPHSGLLSCLLSEQTSAFPQSPSRLWQTPALVLGACGGTGWVSHVCEDLDRDLLENNFVQHRGAPQAPDKAAGRGCRSWMGISGSKCPPSTARAGGAFTLPSLTPWSCWNLHGQSKEKENLEKRLSSNAQDENPTSQRVEFPHCSDLMLRTCHVGCRALPQLTAAHPSQTPHSSSSLEMFIQKICLMNFFLSSEEHNQHEAHHSIKH